ncbi:MAG: hypothetical protein M3H12_00185 [Chromatiales bacterium]|nr:hypothetical protein [Gammaproteobacteria bacterium]
MSNLQLLIDDKIYTGWTGVRVMRSMEMIADAFELSLTDKWGVKGLSAADIKTGMACSIEIDGELVITGYIDEALPEYNATSHTVKVAGRSLAGDLVDCSLQSKQFTNTGLLKLATEHCKPFGIDVSADVDVGKPFRTIAREDGQPIHEFLERAARIRVVRLVSQPEGNLLITRAGDKHIETALVLGENIRAASGQFTTRERFSDYIVQGQNTAWDTNSGEASAGLRYTVKDERWPTGRYRPKVVLAEENVDIDDCVKRATWQRNTAFGRSQGIVYTVSGWRHQGGLWLPNRLVPIQDQWMGIERELLTVSTQFLLDKEGERTEIRVMPKEAFNLDPLPEPDDTSLWGPAPQ